MVPTTVEDLEPNTTYYAYFVLKGTAQEISRVYVYQFTTEPIRPPKITFSSIGIFPGIAASTALNTR